MKKLTTLLITVLFAALTALTVCADYETGSSNFIEDTGLLSDEEYTDIFMKLCELGNKHDFDAVIVLVNDFEGLTSAEYSKQVLKDYGIGGSYFIFTVNNETREYDTRSGGAVDSKLKGKVDSIISKIKPELSNGNYATAFDKLITEVDGCFTTETDGGKLGMPVIILISVGAGVIIALIVVLIMASGNKTVHKAVYAGDYLRSGSFVLSDKRDIYMYRKVEKREKPKENTSSSSGSSGSF